MRQSVSRGPPLARADFGRWELDGSPCIDALWRQESAARSLVLVDNLRARYTARYMEGCPGRGGLASQPPILHCDVAARGRLALGGGAQLGSVRRLDEAVSKQ